MTSSQTDWYLYVQNGPLAGSSLALQHGLQTIGRDPANQIAISDSQISRTHAQITVEENGCWVADLKSVNGTFVNGQKITDSTWLQPEDMIQLGPVVRLVIRSHSASHGEVIDDAPKERSLWRSCLGFLGSLLILFGCMLTGFMGTAYYLFQSGMFTQKQVLNVIGLRGGEVHITNLADDRLDVGIYLLDENLDNPQLVHQFTIPSFESDGLGGIDPGNYWLAFSTPSEQPKGGGCFLDVRNGYAYQFMAVPEGITVTLEGEIVTNPAEVDLQTSGLCIP